jgi:hypothetical protein
VDFRIPSRAFRLFWLAVLPGFRFAGCVSALDSLIRELRETCAGLPDRREGPYCEGQYTMADIGVSAFSVFFMGSPSFLAHQRRLEEGQGRSNCQTLFGIGAIPTDAYIRLMLDGVPADAFDALFYQAIEVPGVLEPFRCLAGRPVIALDGTEHFCSRKVHCPRCLKRKRADGGTEHYHAFLGASLVAPGHNRVVPLPPAFIVAQDGAEKQDCERNAAKRWLSRQGPRLKYLRPVFVGDDLFACQPIAAAIRAQSGNFILTCKPASHKTVAEYLHGAPLEEHRVSKVERGKRTTTVYRWLKDVPLRDSTDALKVTWFSVEILNAAGKRTYFNSFVTDLPVAAENVAELAACGRARWKIENETFNVLKTGDYNLEHNFGHGKATLASVLVVLNLLAFAFHTAAMLAVSAWKQAIAVRGAVYRFFEHLRTIVAYVVFESWDHLLLSIAAAAIRPP